MRQTSIKLFIKQFKIERVTPNYYGIMAKFQHTPLQHTTIWHIDSNFPFACNLSCIRRETLCDKNNY